MQEAAGRTALVATHVVEMVPLKKAGEREEESLKKELEGAREELVRMQGQLKQLQEQSSKTAKALTRAQDELLERDKLITTMKKAQLPISNVTTLEQQVEVDDLRRALNLAQDSVEQMKVNVCSSFPPLPQGYRPVPPPQTIVSQKELLADKYQKLLQEARKELQQVVNAHKGEVTALAEQLRKQEEAAFSQRAAAVLSAANPPMPVLLTGDQLVRLKELEELVGEQEKVNAKLSQQVQQVRREAVQSEQGLRAQLDRTLVELTEKHCLETGGESVPCLETLSTLHVVWGTEGSA